MEEFNKNIESELLVQLLDGELPAEAEQSVFSSVAASPELQSEFKDLMAIRESVRQDIEAFTPPAALTKSVFAALDFSPINQVPPINTIKPKKPLFKRIWKPTLALLLLLVPYLAYVQMQDEHENHNDQISAMNAAKTPKKNIESAHGSSNTNLLQKTAVVKSLDNNITNSNNNNYAYITKQNINSITETSELNNISAVQEKKDVYSNLESNTTDADLIVNNINHDDNYFRRNIELPKYDLNKVETNNMPFTVSKRSTREQWTLSLKGMYSLSSPENNMMNSPGQSFGLGIFIDALSNLSMGAEFGIEPFGQVFSQKDQSVGTYDQKPTLTWIGISAKYKIEQFTFAGIVPFTQITAAGSELGPLGKLALGFEFNLIGNMNMFSGVETSVLLYKNQNIWYNTVKTAAHCGLNYKL